jgi:hypothetical protein
VERINRRPDAAADGAAAAVAAAGVVSGFRPVEAVGAGAGRTGPLLSFAGVGVAVGASARPRPRAVSASFFGASATAFSVNSRPADEAVWLRSWLPTPYPPAKPIARPTVSASTSGHPAERARSSGVSAAASCPVIQADRTGDRHFFDRHITFTGDRLEVHILVPVDRRFNRRVVLEEGKRFVFGNGVFGNGVFSSMLRNRQR